MSTLLKDMPIHKERIEGNRMLENSIRDIMETYSLDNGDIPDVISEIMPLITDFVNENYEWKKTIVNEYEKGYEQGHIDYEEDNPPLNEEKSNTDFVVEKFSDCETFAEFKEVFNELRNLSYTYMR